MQLALLAISLLWASLHKGVHCWELALRAGHLVLPRLAGCLKVLLLGGRQGLLGICGLPCTPGRQQTFSGPPWDEGTVHSRCLSTLLLAGNAGERHSCSIRILMLLSLRLSLPTHMAVFTAHVGRPEMHAPPVRPEAAS